MTSKQCKSEKFLRLPVADRGEILRDAGVHLYKTERILEKDVWLCWSLQTLFSMPDAHPMVFEGGTSEWCTTIRRHSTTSSLVSVKSKVQSTLGRLSDISQRISAQERAGGQMLRWGGKVLQTEYS